MADTPPTTTPAGPFDGLPAFKPLPANLPQQMASALVELRNALTDPPSMGGQWPFANPPRLQHALDTEAKARGGRPVKTQPNQVVRLVRFVRLGDSITAAAKKAGLKRSYAQRILAGQAAIAHHPAVTAAGVELPAMRQPLIRHKPATNPAKPPGAPQTTPAGVDAPSPHSNAPEAAAAECEARS